MTRVPQPLSLESKSQGFGQKDTKVMAYGAIQEFVLMV